KNHHSSRFPNSTLHQRDSRSALFEGYNGGGRSSSDATTTRRQFQTPSPSPGVGGGYGYSGGYPGSNGNGGHLGVDNNSRGGFRPATPNSRPVFPLRCPSSTAPPASTSSGQYDDATIESLESQNDSQVSGILDKVSILKSMSVAMGDEIRDSTAMMEKMNDTFDNTRLRVRGTMNRMMIMADRTGVGWRVWLGFFVAVVFVFIYVWLF
ncbi:SNARE domain-containing protein, partial [Apiospora marii]|uniref:SNARE domain-containing protein n=1 Tax=Apiospora marii TaxID=335849 RepID=UPI003130633D